MLDAAKKQQYFAALDMLQSSERKYKGNRSLVQKYAPMEEKFLSRDYYQELTDLRNELVAGLDDAVDKWRLSNKKKSVHHYLMPVVDKFYKRYPAFLKHFGKVGSFLEGSVSYYTMYDDLGRHFGDRVRIICNDRTLSLTNDESRNLRYRVSRAIDLGDRDYNEARREVFEPWRDCRTAVCEDHDQLRYSMSEVAKNNERFNLFIPVVLEMFGDTLIDDAVAFDTEARQVTYSTSLRNTFVPTARRRSSLGRYINRKCRKSLSKCQQLMDEYSDATPVIPNHYLKRGTKDMTSLESLLDQYVTEVVSKLTDFDDCFEVVSGEDITEAYNEEFGGHSCMTSVCSRYVEVYALNHQKVSLLKFDDGRRTARALLWLTDDGRKVMDRIYPNSGRHLPAFRQWAKDNGFLQRATNHADDTTVNGQIDDQPFKITLTYNDYLPYMDTFAYGFYRNHIDRAESPRIITITNRIDDLKTFDPERANHLTELFSTCGHFLERYCVNCDLGVGLLSQDKYKANHPYHDTTGPYYFCSEECRTRYMAPLLKEAERIKERNARQERDRTQVLFNGSTDGTSCSDTATQITFNAARSPVEVIQGTWRFPTSDAAIEANVANIE